MEVIEYDPKNVSISGVECIREGTSAILVYVEGEEHWIPRSQMLPESEVWGRGDIGVLVCSKWIAKERGLWNGN